MRKTIMPAALGVLALTALIGSRPASAAPAHSRDSAAVVRESPAYGGDEDDDDDDDDDETGTTSPSSGSEAGSGSSTGSGQLAATGVDASSIALLGAFAVTAGGVLCRVGSRRTRPTSS